MEKKKKEVHDFWNRASCGEELYLSDADREGYERQARTRYALEPFIREFARFERMIGKRVLEIGVGMGADHQSFAEEGAKLYGIDITKRALEHTARRFATFGLSSRLVLGDAEYMSFPDHSFDVVYSWGVLHHSPDTEKAVSEVWRVLKPGGVARIMMYHRWSVVGLMLWIRYALFRFRPWYSIETICEDYLESPGTKVYSISEIKNLFRSFSCVDITPQLTHADLLESKAGQRHEGWLIRVARRIWPRSMIRSWFPKFGLFLLIEARKR